ncbi:LuxR C-terminal-related transcriptional regulator [Streptomyces sp. NRRL WC-3742]|uniref:LuxR C-terminal-related transcriptional regulator n=1 Tax=Streptomyces sp. NRRL WC-3742 TaxID=1463934 RepID=UPI00068EEF70|nr:LuxR C-terminal-related transcriptional regulator [Streptomyces sp. NRRL WC-3742]
MQLIDCGTGAESWYDRAVIWRNRTLRLLDHVPVPIAVCEYGGRIILANRAMAAEFGLMTGQLQHRKILDLFTLRDSATLPVLAEAVRLHRRSQYDARVSWTAAGNIERHGEMNVALVSDTPEEQPNLLLSLRTHPEPQAPPPVPPPAPRAEVSPTEARILAAAARGATTARIAKEIGLTTDGVNYHLTRLSRRWHVPNRTALVARAYAYGVLAADAWPPEPAHRT